MPVGRPNAFTPERAAKAIDALRAGNTRECAAKRAGVTASTLYEWIQKARAGNPEYAEFSEMLLDAESQAESEMVNVVRQTALAGDARAALEWLARRRHQTWGRKDTVRLQRLPDPEQLSPAQLKAAIEAALTIKARLPR